jgi:uncharacterized phage protein gp47/JayE
VRGLVRDNVRASLPGADASVPNSVLRVLSDAQGGLCHLTLQYIDWLALQLMPDTAETEWLDRHGQIWLVNADGTIGRKQPTFARGTFTMTGDESTVVPTATQFTGGFGVTFSYESLETIILAANNQPTPLAVRALDPGAGGNLEPGSMVSLTVDVPGADGGAIVVKLAGGTDIESDDDLRARVLSRIRQPPMGGDKTDYEQWALAVPGVTRAWSGPLEMGMGTVTVRFLMDDLRASDDGWPTEDDIEAVTAYLDKMRPVAVKDFFVVAPLKHPVDVHIVSLNPDTPAVRAEIKQNLKDMLFTQAKPGQTIYAAWKSYAIMNVTAVTSFNLGNNTDDVMESPGHMAVLGDIYYEFPHSPAVF